MTTSAQNVGSSLRRFALRPAHDDSAPSVTNTTTATVYDVSVEGAHEFFANGRLVHNCSGAVSAELSALVRGPDMIMDDRSGPAPSPGLIPETPDLLAGWMTPPDWSLFHPTDAPSDAAMIIAVIQTGADPSTAANAHMICRVPGSPNGIDIEMGGTDDNYHTSQTTDTCASVYDTGEFNQWFYLPVAHWPLSPLAVSTTPRMPLVPW